MDTKQRTKINDKNRDKFYQQVYHQQFRSKQQLINLEMFSEDCVVIDCCGWHYCDLFPTKNIIRVETVKSAVDFKLDRSKFDKLLDDRDDHIIKWPKLEVDNPILIFDQSPILKYRSISNLITLLSDAVEKYQASQLVVNLNTLFIDDPRLIDRFYNLASINIPKFVIVEFEYSSSNTKLFIKFKRKYVDQPHSN